MNYLKKMFVVHKQKINKSLNIVFQKSRNTPVGKKKYIFFLNLGKKLIYLKIFNLCFFK